MNIIRKIAVLGGDERSAICAEHLARAGFECAVCGLEKSSALQNAVRGASLADTLRGSNVVLLPLPTSVDGKTVFAPYANTPISLEEITSALEKGALLLAGNPSDDIQKLFHSHETANYAVDEGFVYRNRVPTAEGAIQIALEELGKTLHGTPCLVCGYGRIGRYLTRLLCSFGAKVTVSARKRRDLIEIEQSGAYAVKTDRLGDCPIAFDVIFNTVPYPILNGAVLRSLRGKPLIVELASKPYGADFAAPKKDTFKVPFGVISPPSKPKRQGQPCRLHIIFRPSIRLRQPLPSDRSM